MRESLFADAPLARFVQVQPQTLAQEPWASFNRAHASIEAGDLQFAIQILRGIVEMPNLEPRFYLHAWNALRGLNIAPPPEKAKELLGVVVEVGMPKGLDLLAAYPDHCARYYNFSNAAVIWERPNDVLNEAIDRVINVSLPVLRAIGPWKEARPPAPSSAEVRVNFLTPSGLHFGQGSLADLSRDPMAGPIIAAAFQLMQQMIAQAQMQRGK
jgi:hypothetical protein